MLGYCVGKMDLLLKNAENKRTNKSWTILYIKNGSGMFLYEGRLLCLNESDILVFPPKTSYSFVPADLGDEYNANIDAVVIRFEQNWTDSFLRTFPCCSDMILSIKELNHAAVVGGTKWFRLSTLMGQLESSSSLQEAVLVIEILQQIADRSDMQTLASDPITSEVPDVEERISRIDRYISCHLLETITLDSISAYAGMNRTYFCMFFKRHFGTGLVEYLNARRIDVACTLLSDHSLSISDIALQCGFRSVTYFNRVFKAAKGISPSRLRSASSL